MIHIKREDLHRIINIALRNEADKVNAMQDIPLLHAEAFGNNVASNIVLQVEEASEDVALFVTHSELADGVKAAEQHDPVNHPQHYTDHPSGIECIQVTEHMGFNLGNAVKYIWRCDLKKKAIEDLKKARWYIDREIAKRESEC